MIRPLVLSTLFLLLSLHIFGQKLQLSGYITDPEHRALESVNIQIQGRSAGTSSNIKGYYELEVMAYDSLQIIFTCIGYTPQTHTLRTRSSNPSLSVILQPSQTQLEDVNITEIRRQLTPMQKLDATRTKLLPDVTGGSIEALISTFAGVSSVNELSSQYSVRGGSYDENMVYINGIEIYRPQLVRAGQQEGMSIINPDLVQEVNFSSGGFEARYGDKMSSVLDITYKKPKGFEGSVSVGLLGASLYIGHATKDQKFTQIHGVRYRNNAGILGTMDTKGEYRPWDIDYQLYMTWKVAPKWEISLMGNIAQNSYQFFPQTRETAFGSVQLSRKFKVYFDGQEQDIFRTLMGAATISYKPIDNLKLDIQASVFNTNEQESYDIRGEYWLSELDMNNPSSSSNSGTEVDGSTLGVGTYMEHARNTLDATVSQVSHHGGYEIKDNNFKWGIGFQIEDINDKMREWEMRDSAGYSMPNNPTRVDLVYTLDSKYSMRTFRTTGYIQDTQKFRSSIGLFTLNIGARFNYWSFNNELTVSPRAALSFLPARNHNLAFRLSGGWYYQAPFYREYRDTTTTADRISHVTLNSDIKSPRSLQVILGGDYYFKAWNRPFKFTTEVYYKDMDNLIPFNVDGVRIRYLGENMAKGWSAGVDMKLFGEFVPGVDSWISLTIMKSEEIINGVHIPRPNDQRYNFSIFFQDYLPNYKPLALNLKFIWADGLPFGAPREPREKATYRMPAYRRVDIGISWTLVRGRDKLMNQPVLRHLKGISIGLDCFNLLGINNVNSYYWVTDVYNTQYAVPNYLTNRMINFRLQVDF